MPENLVKISDIGQSRSEISSNYKIGVVFKILNWASMDRPKGWPPCALTTAQPGRH